MTGGTAILLDRWSDICRALGLSPSQACLWFGVLPPGSQQAAWDDLRRGSSGGTA